MRTDALDKKHYQSLYEIHKRAERYHVPDYMQFRTIMGQREGFVVVAPNGELAGCISFYEYVPEVDIAISCFIDPPFRRKWASRNIYKRIFDYVFETLFLPRVTGYVIKSVNDDAAEFLLRCGFKYEGAMRQRIRMPDKKICDLEIYGLLKEERRW